jgi:long-chain fatty acid transport protein
MKKLSLFLLATLGGSAHANGFLLNEFDAKAVGRGNAVTASDTDPSSIYYNIGGLAGGEGTNVQVGGSLIAPEATFTDTAGNKTASDTNPQGVVGVFVSSRVSSLISLGFGFYTPFGLAISWPATSLQTDVVKDEALHTFFLTPSFGLNLGSYVPGLTAGVGMDIVPATVELKQYIPFGDVMGVAHLGGTAVGVGARVGAMYKPPSVPGLSVGAMYRTDVKLDFSGSGDFDAPAPFRGQLPPDGDVHTSVTLPQQVSGGVAYKFLPDFELEANVIWTNWSKFKELNITVPAAGSGTMVIGGPREWENKTTFRVGAEYGFPTIGAAVRAGYIYDPTPVPATHLTAELPDFNRHDVTIGASKTFGDYGAHVGLLWVLPGSRTTSDVANMPEHKGTYDVSAFVATVTISGHFSH